MLPVHQGQPRISVFSAHLPIGRVANITGRHEDRYLDSIIPGNRKHILVEILKTIVESDHHISLTIGKLFPEIRLQDPEMLPDILHLSFEFCDFFRLNRMIKEHHDPWRQGTACKLCQPTPCNNRNMEYDGNR